MQQIVTKGDLVAYLSGIRGATFATMLTETAPKLLKTGNPFKDVRKVSRVNVCLGFQYAKSVNRQREREGDIADFEAAPRQWGVRIPGTVLVKNEKTGMLYLETKIEKSLDHRYIDAKGTAIPDDLIAPFLPAKSESRQHVEKEILVRDYSIDSIREIHVNGNILTVA